MPKMRTTLVLFRALNNKVDSKTRHCNVHETQFFISKIRHNFITGGNAQLRLLYYTNNKCIATIVLAKIIFQDNTD